MRDLVGTLRELISADTDSHTTIKSLDEKIKEFNKQRKEGGAATEPSDESDAEEA